MSVELMKQGNLICLDGMAGVMFALGDWLPISEDEPILTVEADPKAGRYAIKSGEKTIAGGNMEALYYAADIMLSLGLWLTFRDKKSRVSIEWDTEKEQYRITREILS